MRLPLTREEKFFDLFMDDARNVLAAARMLEQFFRNYDERERIAGQLRDAEHAGDQISHDIGRKLEATFVTPLDREDIHALINRLDDIVDFIEEVADTCILYGIDAAVVDCAAAGARSSSASASRSPPPSPSCAASRDWSSMWIEVHRLENEGDGIVRQAMGELFKNGKDAIEVIKWKEVTTALEKTIDGCEDAADVIEGIVVKHA